MVRRFLYLNGIATLCVILYHASAWGFISMFWWTDRYRAVSVPNFDALGGAVYYGLRFIEQSAIIAIPSFLFVSGFFAAAATGRTRNTLGYDIVWKRIRGLIIPFLFWSLALLALATLAGGMAKVREVVASFQEAPLETALDYGWIIITGQSTEAFYFVPVLIQLYLLAPLMMPWAKNRPWALLILTGALQLVVALLRYPNIIEVEVPALSWAKFLTTSWFFPGYIFWFALGTVFGFHSAQIKPRLVGMRLLLMVAVVLLFIVGMIEWEMLLRLSGKDWVGPVETLVDQIFALAFLLLFLGSEAVKLPQTGRISALGTRSFGVYLVHTLALIYTARIIYNLAPVILSFTWVFQVLLFIMGLGIPLALMWALDRSPARRMYSYIFG